MSDSKKQRGRPAKSSDEASEMEKLVPVSTKLPPTMSQRLDSAATGIGLDRSALLRMMIKKFLPIYEKRAAKIRHLESLASNDQPSLT